MQVLSFYAFTTESSGKFWNEMKMKSKQTTPRSDALYYYTDLQERNVGKVNCFNLNLCRYSIIITITINNNYL